MVYLPTVEASLVETEAFPSVDPALIAKIDNSS